MDRIASQRPLRWSHQAGSPLGRDKIAWPTRGIQQREAFGLRRTAGPPGVGQEPDPAECQVMETR